MSQKIFIIEDDENILYGLQDRFTSDGFEVILSDAGEEIDDLLVRLKKEKPDHVILDLLLPKLDGLEVVRRIKADEEISDINVLIFTDLSDEDSRTRSVGLGVNYYFLKSEMDINEFADRVETIIRGKLDEDVMPEEAEENENDLVME